MLLDELRAYIGALGIANSGTDLFASLPDSPDEAIAISEYPGEPPMHVKRREAPVHERPRFQVATRSKRYDVARIKAERIYQALDGFSGKLSGVSYARITARHSPSFLSKDESDRYTIVCNYECIKDLSPLP